MASTPANPFEYVYNKGISPAADPKTATEIAIHDQLQKEWVKKQNKLLMQAVEAYAAQPMAQAKHFPLKNMLAMRLTRDPHGKLPFDFLEVAPLNEERVVVFLIHNGQHVSIEDDAKMFPSDALVTQLRVLMG